MTRPRLSDALWLIALTLLFVTLVAWAVAANDVPEQDSSDWCDLLPRLKTGAS